MIPRQSLIVSYGKGYGILSNPLIWSPDAMLKILQPKDLVFIALFRAEMGKTGSHAEGSQNGGWCAVSGGTIEARRNLQKSSSMLVRQQYRI